MKVGDLVRDKYWSEQRPPRTPPILGVIVRIPSPLRAGGTTKDIVEVLVFGGTKLRSFLMSSLEVVSESR